MGSASVLVKSREQLSVETLKKVTKEKAPIPALHGQNGLVYIDQDKAEAFANSLEDQCSPNYDTLDEKQSNQATSR